MPTTSPPTYNSIDQVAWHPWCLVLFLCVAAACGSQAERAHPGEGEGALQASEGSSREATPNARDDCYFGEPRALFAALKDDARHSFEVQGQRSQEVLLDEDGAERMRIYQEGCESLLQAFELYTSTSFGTWAEVREPLATQFDSLSRLDDALFGLAQYANSLRAVPPDYPMPQPALLAPGLSLRVLAIPPKHSGWWRVEFAQDAPGTGAYQ